MNHRLLRTRRPAARGGVALVLFAALVFVFLAIASVAIDVGRACATQQQMQVAVDTAALEGVRMRDVESYQHYNNVARRPRVSNLVRWVFDDDLHPTNPTPQPFGAEPIPADGPDELHVGAGPIFSIQGGAGPLNARGTIVTPTLPFWDDPVLETNTGGPSGAGTENVPYGDQVSGTYYPDQSHVENSIYERSDFRHGTSVEYWKSTSYLVRMRRSGTANPLDNQPGVSMSGPTIPFLFGLGTLMTRAQNSVWDPRYQGLTVRATAIASGVPALRASPRPLNPDGTPITAEGFIGPGPMMGVHPIALSYDYWVNHMTVGNWPPPGDELQIDPTGQIRTLTTNEAVGRFATIATCVGQPIVSTGPVAMPGGLMKSGYVAIYAPIVTDSGGLEDRVIGYVFADAYILTANGHLSLTAGIKSHGIGGQTSEVTVWIGANGVSARLDATAPQISENQWIQVFAKNRQLAYGPWPGNPTGEVTNEYTRIRPGTLLAPVLVR